MNRCTREIGTRLRIILFAAACVCLHAMLASSCQTHERGVDADVQAQATKRVVGARLDEQDLAKVGLETLWYNPPTADEHPVTGVYLLDDGLYLATQPIRGMPGKLKKLLRNDGMTAWYYDIHGLLADSPTVFRYPSRQPGTYDELFIVLNNTVHCLGVEHGDLLWKLLTNFTIATSVAASANRFFAGSENKRVYGVEKNHGMIDWTHLTGDFVEADPASDGAAVYVGSNDGSLYRFSAVAGWREGFSWEFATGARIASAPVVFAKWVLVGSADYKLYCLNAADGSVVWEFLAEAPILDSPVVYSYRPGREYAYCIATDPQRAGEMRTLFAVRMRGGVEAWRFEGVRKVVSIGKKNLYVLTDVAGSGGQRALVALDALSGKEQFRLDVDSGFRFVPVNLADHGRSPVERGRIYLVGGDGAVQAIAER